MWRDLVLFSEHLEGLVHADHVAKVIVQALACLVNSQVGMGQVISTGVQCLNRGLVSVLHVRSI